MTYSIDPDIETSVNLNSYGEYMSVDGEFKVKNVMACGEPLDTEKIYTVGSLDYLLENGVRKYFISGNVDIIRDDIMSDSEAFIQYIKEDLGGKIPEKYRDPKGQGRITEYSHDAGENDSGYTEGIGVHDSAADTTEKNPGTGVPFASFMFIAMCGSGVTAAFTAKNKTKQHHI